MANEIESGIKYKVQFTTALRRLCKLYSIHTIHFGGIFLNGEEEELIVDIVSTLREDGIKASATIKEAMKKSRLKIVDF